MLIETVKPEKTDATVSLSGLEYIDVPALSKRDYKMSFFTYREGQYNTKVCSHVSVSLHGLCAFLSSVLTSPFNPLPQVTFRNEVTGEYLFYLVTFRATSPGVLSTVELETAVRRMVSGTIEVENPLTTSTCLTTECKCPEISAPPQHTVPGQSKVSDLWSLITLNRSVSTDRLKRTPFPLCVWLLCRVL